jgi:hypothetical protein
MYHYLCKLLLFIFSKSKRQTQYLLLNLQLLPESTRDKYNLIYQTFKNESHFYKKSVKYYFFDKIKIMNSDH